MCYDLLDSRAPEQLIKQMLTILTKSLPLVQPPYGMINEESRTTLIEARDLRTKTGPAKIARPRTEPKSRTVRVGPIRADRFPDMDVRRSLIEAESEEILPILDQFQNLRVFDQFFAESDFFLRKYEKSRDDVMNEKIEKQHEDDDENEMKKIHFPKLSLGPKPSGGARRKKSNPNLKVELLESGSKNGIPHTLRIDFDLKTTVVVTQTHANDS